MYQCHLKLWDMSYALMAGNAPCGVLFAGQVLLDQEDHIQQIKAAIEQETPAEHKLAVHTALEHAPRISLKDRDARFQESCDFGKMVQTLATSVYDKGFDATFHSFLTDTGVQLTDASAQNEEEWWAEVAKVAGRLRAFTNLESILFFSRRTSRYDLKATDLGAEPDRRLCLPTRIVAPLHQDTLQPLPADIRSRLGPCLPAELNTESHIFTRDLAGNRQLGISTAVVLNGTIGSRLREPVEDFCRLVCLRADVTNLVFRIERDAKAVQTRVRDVLHHTKNPLQRILTWQEDDDCFVGDELAPSRDQTVNQVMFVRDYLRGLYSTAVPRRSECDLAPLCQEVIDDLAKQVGGKNCAFAWVAPPPTAMVVADRLELRIVLDNILDNAVKYSWHGLAGRTRSIRVNLRVAGIYAEFEVTDYGIGIPEPVLAALREDTGAGVRGEVEDKVAMQRWHEQRAGSGLGVPISKRIIESHGGWLDIDSRPADDDARGPDEQYHRYLTFVSICLPLMKDQHG
jgi:signal transduction histidine kinase